MTQPKTASKFTPGPWEWAQYSPTTPEHHSAILSSPDDDGVLFHEAAWQVSKADARLIAAAPEMYELLEQIDRAKNDMSDRKGTRLAWFNIICEARRIKAAIDGEG